MADNWTNKILDFWFGELTPESWFSGGGEVDVLIQTRFAKTYAELADALPEEAMTNPRAALAAVVALDQFPRNMFRGTAKAFASDDLALAVAHNALEKGFDRGMTADERGFLAMPLMHSEVLTDQHRCVDLFREIGNEESLRYALEHRDIVARFGRFPHRNRTLGRESTVSEREFMDGHKGYGQ